MKLFLIAALITVSYAARLEHLEQQKLRAYLPPNKQPGANGALEPLGPNGAGVAGTSQPGVGVRGSFPGATTKYLPPDQGSSASDGSPQFAGSINGFEPKLPVDGQEDAPELDAGLQGAVGGENGDQGISSTTHSSQNIPQQAFDEETGYRY